MPFSPIGRNHVFFFSFIVSTIWHRSAGEINDEYRDRIDSWESQPCIDFVDLEKGKVVAPWKFEVRNIDKFLNHSALEGAVIFLVIDDSIHETGFLVSAWQKRVVHYATINLPAGEYVATLRLADPDTQELLGLESPPRLLSVIKHELAYKTQPAALISSVKPQGLLSLVFIANTHDLDLIESLSVAWRGPLSVAIFLNYLDLDNLESVLSSIGAMHVRVEESAVSALTISFLSAAECGSGVSCGDAYPALELTNLAIEAVDTDLLLLTTTQASISLPIVQASADPRWIRGCAEAAAQGVALIVPLLDMATSKGTIKAMPRATEAGLDEPPLSSLVSLEHVQHLSAKVQAQPNRS
jgi:hypothetical protein